MQYPDWPIDQSLGTQANRTDTLVDDNDDPNASGDEFSDNNNDNETNIDKENDDTSISSSSSSTHHPSLPLCQITTNRQIVLLNPPLFFRKTILVILASYSLLPLLLYKSSLPGALYASLLIIIHVGVLVVYCYRVRFMDLDVDRLSLGGRILGLGTVIWLLTVVSGWQDHEHVQVLAVQMLVLCLVHTLVLALLMVAIEPVAEVVAMEEEEEEEIIEYGCSLETDL